MNRKAFFWGAFLGGALLWAGDDARAQGTLQDDLSDCRRDIDPFRRLTCYDNLVDGFFGAARPTPGTGSQGDGRTNGDAPAKPGNPDAIAEFAGVGQFLTRVFYAPGPWEIRWRATGQQFQIFLSDNLGNFLEVVANQAGPGPGGKAMATPGAFTLNITADGPWAIEVVPAGQ